MVFSLLNSFRKNGYACLNPYHMILILINLSVLKESTYRECVENHIKAVEFYGPYHKDNNTWLMEIIDCLILRYALNNVINKTH